MRAVGGAWFLPLLVAAGAALLVAVLGATITVLGPWYQALEKPDWAPPDAAFGIIWTIVFSFTAIAAVTAWRRAPTSAAASTLIGAFALNGFLNILWSLLFFRLQRPDWALVEIGFLWLSIAALIVLCGRYSRAAAVLLLPYLIWVTIAGVLNYDIIRLNPGLA